MLTLDHLISVALGPEIVTTRYKLELRNARFNKELRRMDHNLGLMPIPPARNIDRLPDSVSDKVGPVAPVLHPQMRYNYDLTEPENTVMKGQALVVDRAEYRVDYSDFLKQNLVAAKARKDNGIPSITQQRLTELDLKKVEEDIANNASRQSRLKTKGNFFRAAGGHPITKFKKRQCIPDAAIKPPQSPRAIARKACLQYIILALRALTKMTASYKKAEKERERRVRKKRKLRKRFDLGLKATLGLCAGAELITILLGVRYCVKWGTIFSKATPCMLMATKTMSAAVAHAGQGVLG